MRKIIFYLTSIRNMAGKLFTMLYFSKNTFPSIVKYQSLGISLCFLQIELTLINLTSSLKIP